MNKRGQAVLAAYVALFAASAIAFHFGADAFGKGMAVPLVFLSGWAFLGHLITIDDELPGGWSNPEGSRAVWSRSLAEMVLKVVLFVASIWLLLQGW